MEIAKLILEYMKALAWPITAIFLAIYFRKSLISILARLEKATLPGGISLDFEKKIKQIEALSEKVSATPEPKQLPKAALVGNITANRKMIEIGLTPVQSGLNISYFLGLADDNPLFAIAALRIEIEILVKNLIVGCNLPISPDKPTKILIEELSKTKALNDDQASLAIKILELCNLVLHGKKISRETAQTVFNTGVAALYLDYFMWLSTK